MARALCKSVHTPQLYGLNKKMQNSGKHGKHYNLHNIGKRVAVKQIPCGLWL